MAASTFDVQLDPTSPPGPSSPHLDTASFLNSDLSPFHKKLKVAHINAESLRGHIDEVRAIFRHNIFDVIAVSESWLKPSISSGEVLISGYALLRNDRINKRCGGVAVFIKEHLKSKVLYSSPQEYSARPEFMFIEIGLSVSDALLLGICYRPPKIGHMTDFENILLHFMPSYSHVLVMGDMNTDLLMTNRNYDYNQLTDMFNCCNMTILPLDATHHTADSNTLIDLIIVSDPKDVVHTGQLSIPAVSRHDLIYCVLSVNVPKPKVKFIKYRDFKRMDEIAFMQDVLSTSWHLVENHNSVNDMVETLNSLLLCLLDKHAPMVTKRVNKRRPVPWLTQDIFKLMAQRDSVFRKAKRTGDLETMNQYRHLRNRVKQSLRNSRLRYINTLFGNKKQSTSDLWHSIKKLGFGKQATPVPVEIPLNELNDYFLSFSQSHDNVALKNYLSHLPSQNALDPTMPQFRFKRVLQVDILRAIRRITSTATGCDNISIILVKKVLFAILPILTTVFNKSLQTGTFPDIWRCAIVRPLNKIPSPLLHQDYRPISILPALSKGLERIVHSQISEFMRENNKLNIYQSGFRQCHSTETALLRITDDIRLAMDRRQCTILTVFDFSKAFDTVNHSLLLAKLRQLGFSEMVLSWMGSYLSGRRQCVRVNDNMSEWKPVTCGVPQGSILGPLLFNLYINDISNVLKHTKFHCYADDLQIYTHCTVSDISVTVDNINKDIDQLVKWTQKHGLQLNPVKTKPIVIAYSRLFNTIEMNHVPKIAVNGMILPFYENVKSLGLTINNKLDWTDYVTGTCNKVFAAVHTLKKMQRFLPFHIKLLLIRSLVFPYFNYCNAVVNDMTVSLSNKLQRSQNYCIRFLFDLRRDEHITPYYIRTSILKLSDSRVFRILTLLYSILKNHIPQYFVNEFEFIIERSARNTRTGSSMLRIPHHRTAMFNKSFIVTACRTWNSLPDSIKNQESRARFTSELRKHLLQQMSASALS